MEPINFLEEFYSGIINDNSLIFDYLKVSEFERNLFLSVSKFVYRKYDYELKGLMEVHLIRLKENVNLQEEDSRLINRAFSLHTMILERTTTMGYGQKSKRKVRKSYKLNYFIEELGKYIREYQNV